MTIDWNYLFEFIIGLTGAFFVIGILVAAVSLLRKIVRGGHIYD